MLLQPGEAICSLSSYSMITKKETSSLQSLWSVGLRQEGWPWCHHHRSSVAAKITCVVVTAVFKTIANQRFEPNLSWACIHFCYHALSLWVIYRQLLLVNQLSKYKSINSHLLSWHLCDSNVIGKKVFLSTEWEFSSLSFFRARPLFGLSFDISLWLQSLFLLKSREKFTEELVRKNV